MDQEQQHPQAASISREHTYVDDLLYRAPTELQLVELKSDIIEMLNKGGLTMRKWCTNSPFVSSSIPLEQRAIGTTHQWDKHETENTWSGVEPNLRQIPIQGSV